MDKASRGGWQVMGHEGRGRMLALQKRAPDSLFPVAVHPYGEIRARHITPESALDWLRPDEGGDLVARGSVSVLGGKPYEFFQEYGQHPAIEELLEELRSSAH